MDIDLEYTINDCLWFVIEIRLAHIQQAQVQQTKALFILVDITWQFQTGIPLSHLFL